MSAQHLFSRTGAELVSPLPSPSQAMPIPILPTSGPDDMQGHGCPKNNTAVKIDLNKYAESIDIMRIGFGELGGGVDIDLKNKWIDVYSPGSDEPLRLYGASGHHVNTANLIAEYLTRWKAESDAEESQITEALQ